LFLAMPFRAQQKNGYEASAGLPIEVGAAPDESASQQEPDD